MSVEVLNGLRGGSLDAGFYNEAGDPDADLSTVDVASFSIYLAAPPGLLAASEPLDWAVMSELPWICPAAGACCGQAAENLFEKHQIRPKRITTIDRESVTRTLIAGGVGIGLLHADTAEDARDKGEVVLVCKAQEVVRVLFAHRADRAKDPLLSSVTSILRTGGTVSR